MRLKALLLITLSILLLACSAGGLSGTFVDESGLSEITFKSNNKLVLSAVGVKLEMEYSFKDNQVSVKDPNGSVSVLEYDGKDTLKGPFGVSYKRKK